MMKPKPRTSENNAKKVLITKDTKELKKKKLIEKTTVALKGKFKLLIAERNFDITYLRKYIEEIFPANLDDFNYNVFLLKAEKVLLEKLSKVDIKKTGAGVTDLNEVKALIGDLKTNNNNQNDKQNETQAKKDTNKHLSLATLEKEKRNNPWAIQASEDLKNFKDEQKLNKKKDQEKKKQLKEMLDLQVKEKNQKGYNDNKDFGPKSLVELNKNRSKSAEKVVTRNEKSIKLKNKIIDEKANKEFLAMEAKKTEQELVEKNKKNNLIQDMKNQLNKQMEEKSKNILEKKELTKKFDIEVLKNAEKFKYEQAEKLNYEKNINQNYKKELDKQLLEKKVAKLK